MTDAQCVALMAAIMRGSRETSPESLGYKATVAACLKRLTEAKRQVCETPRTALSAYTFGDHVLFDDEDGLAVNTNDWFAWGCADREPVTEWNLPVLVRAIEDSLAAEGDASFGCMLFASRLNRLRPQGACYPENRALWPLLDACGLERDIDSGNPYKPGDRP